MGRLLPGFFFLMLMAVLLITIIGSQNAPPGDMIGETAPALTVMPLDPAAPVPDIARMAAGNGPMLVNFFASWCAPCQAEHAQLLALKRDGVTILGIAWHDNGPMLREWLLQHDDPYRFVGVDTHGETAVAYGASGVPESYLIDATGRIALRIPGPLTPELVTREVLPRLKPVR